MQPRHSFENIVSMIKRFAAVAVESRQISRRLVKLLPTRLYAIRKNYVGQMPISQAIRHALASDDYVEHLEEVIEVSHQARLARMQYETHLMLIDARRSMRRLEMHNNRRLHRK